MTPRTGRLCSPIFVLVAASLVFGTERANGHVWHSAPVGDCVWLAQASASAPQVLASSAQAPAPPPTPVTPGVPGAKLFRASGTHKCQSRTALGHSCTSFDTNFTSCDEAAQKLKLQDCCGKTKEGGASIEFVMGGCSAL